MKDMAESLAKIFQSKFLFPLSFFALAGAIWGWSLYSGEPAEYPLTAVGGLSLAILGGLGLSLPSRNPMFILRVVGLGLVGFLIGFFVLGVGSYPLLLWGTSFLGLLHFPNFLVEWIELAPSLKIGARWLNFFLTGIFIGLVFALAFRCKIWSMVWRSTLGFGLVSLVAPIVGNLIGNALGWPLLSYLITFILISITLGFMLLWGAGKSSNAQRPS